MSSEGGGVSPGRDTGISVTVGVGAGPMSSATWRMVQCRRRRRRCDGRRAFVKLRAEVPVRHLSKHGSDSEKGFLGKHHS